MSGLLVLVALGAAFFFIVPPLILANYRTAFAGNLARIVGVIFILFAFASTSFIFVPDGHVGHLFRVYGGGPLMTAGSSRPTARTDLRPRSSRPASTRASFST
jgi:hypothetical protein